MSEYAYILTVIINNDELVAHTKLDGKLMPVHFFELEKAKALFAEAYKVLIDVPPKDVEAFAHILKLMTTIQPKIIKLQRDKAVQIISDYRADKEVLNCNFSLLSEPVYYLRVKDGFINKFLELDILKDIQSTTSVGPDGKLIIHEFRRMESENFDPSDINISEEDLKDMLKKKGLL